MKNSAPTGPNPLPPGPCRPSVVAGTFYPKERAQLNQMIDEFLAAANVLLDHKPKAVIAPHAGYIYSGPIAGSAFATVARENEIKRVVLGGPSHRVAFTGLALSGSAGFATPLGIVPVDREAGQKLAALPQVRVFDAAHAHEHSLEVELPFLQKILGRFTLVPLVVGDATDTEVGQALDLLWGGPETLLVISSDLSHYHDYETANKLDRQTAAAIEHLRPADIGFEQACGRIPICGLLWAAQKRGMVAQILDLRNSGDTAGSRDRVVGYGAFAFLESQ